MNFKRIEWIFVIAFIALDIFLLSVYITQNDTIDQRTTSFSSNASVSVLKGIKNDQINYGKLSDKARFGYYVSSSNSNILRDKAEELRYSWEYSNRRLTVDFTSGVKVADPEKPNATIDELLSDSQVVLFGKEYTYNQALSTKNVVVYTQTIYGEPVFSSDGQLRFSLKNGYITGYSQGYMDDIKILRERKETISQQRALIWLYQYNKLPSNSQVLWCHMGYTRLLAVNNSMVYTPTWNFCIKNNTTGNIQYRRINAFNGNVMDETISVK
ncbi:two-component system regulatory protein YycI [Ligilactobacillus faecis]|uniref:two-component system regulatory protein YycI n=1 Tax=Ligilactobacillus faecis TaxID=762833 RepID=UPI002469A55F|nr:two-component system regulatory protein YycI [Ligilactobacillus faecis]WGN90120.1 two-component system regulatory protein YycI [Ligilactobacillus faecis]